MTTLQEGIAAAKAGNKKQAQEILQEYLRQNPKNEAAWWWLASVLEKEDASICLRNIIKINPGNQEAELALARLKAGGSTADPTKVFASLASGSKPQPKPKSPAVKPSNWRREKEMSTWLEYTQVMYKQGQNRQQIENDLQAKGLPPEYIALIFKKFSKQREKEGLKKMVRGGLGCLGGSIAGLILLLFLLTVSDSILILLVVLMVVGGTVFVGGAFLIGGLLQYLDLA